MKVSSRETPWFDPAVVKSQKKGWLVSASWSYRTSMRFGIIRRNREVGSRFFAWISPRKLNSSRLNIGLLPKGNSSSNHHFSGAMLNFGGVWPFFFSPINGLTTICFLSNGVNKKTINLEMCFVFFFTDSTMVNYYFATTIWGICFFLSNHQTSKSMFGVWVFSGEISHNGRFCSREIPWESKGVQRLLETIPFCWSGYGPACWQLGSWRKAQELLPHICFTCFCSKCTNMVWCLHASGA